MHHPYVLALDQGTTSSRAILFDQAGQVVAVGQKEFRQIYPQPGWVEHDPDDIWHSQWQAIQECLNKSQVPISQIQAIGIANQRETTIVWNKNTGQPIYNAIVWQCRRTAGYCDTLREQNLSDTFRQKTGLVIDAYFSGTKVAWILDHVPGARDLAAKGELVFGTVDSWLIYKLTDGAAHVTDYSNASRTLLYNIHELSWDEDLLKILNIPSSMCPTVVNSSGICAYTSTHWFGHNIPIAGIAGDQQAALFGQGCFNPGSVKNTYGTGSFLLMNTGTTPVVSDHGLLTTIAWGIGGQITYALEGSIFITGAVVQWLRDELQLIHTAKETEALALSVDSTDGVYVVPAFVGLGAPYWDSYARGTIVGLTRGSNRAHIVRAALESIAYQTRDVLDVMQKDSHRSISALRVDGGAIANQFLAQFQADILGILVQRPQVTETTAMGAAFLAGLATGVWPGFEPLTAAWHLDAEFSPVMDESTRERLYRGWHKAVSRAQNWIDGNDGE
ncbi:glycerol kinase GlpK [Sulfobacillus thermosulfidooxidans]|uniref:glycerol kinase GlpK n=1 Tax=Sulfobacillus thermosulfidooxidans TaxID=28034 RepID=UPI0002D4B574|nr:glycerol kinase GlpK [Sulfobacillus thermosulfidooxidans]